ncbi:MULTISPECIES: phage portal protein [unclassified Streptomyces]|uniref:phage portal protein n=1 Tax=unclassified Streptomyces TaxID=2593676 RepID=UPI00333337AF
MSLKTWWQGLTGGQAEVLETAPARIPERAGYEYGIGPGGLTETQQGGALAGSDRRSTLTQLYDAYLACPWSYASVNAIARTVTAGGLVLDWANDGGQDQEERPEKPAEALLLERMLAFCNPRENIRQILRGVVTDLGVFGDAFVEVVWVGNQPVAMYSLDCPSMMPIADEHGNVTSYVQVTDRGQRAVFEPREIIHISLDAPRSGLFGVSPTQAAMLPITSWLFASATSKEIFRKGAPPQIHVDFPAAASQADIRKWDAQYHQQNLGPRNIGTPIKTKGGAQIQELAQSRTVDYLKFLEQRRDEIIAAYGVPPAKVGIIESGNIGGGTGESQDRTFMVNTCQPIAELILEAFNFHLVTLGFGITDWRLKFADIDMRDSKVVEQIRDMRLRSGAWTLNRYRADIGEPSIEGGDRAVLVDRTNFVQWDDMDAMSQAGVADRLKGTSLAMAVAASDKPVELSDAPEAPAPPEPPPPAETLKQRYRRRLQEALAELPGGVDERAA